MKALFLTTVLPAGGPSGGEVVSQSLIDVLDDLGEVCAVGYRRRSEEPMPGSGGELCVGQRPIETSEAGIRSLGWMLRALVARTPYSSAKYQSRAYTAAVRDRLARSPSVVLIDHAQVHFALNVLDLPEVPTVFVAHNVEADDHRRLAAQAGRPIARWLHRREARLIGAAELKLATRARQVWALTQDDAQFFSARVPDADVRLLEVPSRIVASPTRGPRCDIGLLGTWTWGPNALGLRWFAAEVVPRLPVGLRIEVAGRGAEWLRDSFPNLSVRGVVPDAQAFLEQAKTVAVPSVAGSGVQIKTLDAIASGVPVVATSVATRGLGPLPGSVAVADGPAAFAEQLIRLAQIPGARVGPDLRAVAWSGDRQLRFRDSVVAWIAELTPPVRPQMAVAKETRP